MIKTKIIDGTGTGRQVKVLSTGALAVSSPSYDDAVFNTLDTDAQGYTFYGPKDGKQFVLTGVIAFADKEVSDNTDTDITIYESDGDGSATENKILLKFGMGRLTSISILPLNVITNLGKWVNAKTTDDDVHMTILGYYIDKI